MKSTHVFGLPVSLLVAGVAWLPLAAFTCVALRMADPSAPLWATVVFHGGVPGAFALLGLYTIASHRRYRVTVTPDLVSVRGLFRASEFPVATIRAVRIQAVRQRGQPSKMHANLLIESPHDRVRILRNLRPLDGGPSLLEVLRQVIPASRFGLQHFGKER